MSNTETLLGFQQNALSKIREYIEEKNSKIVFFTAPKNAGKETVIEAYAAESGIYNIIKLNEPKDIFEFAQKLSLMRKDKNQVSFVTGTVFSLIKSGLSLAKNLLSAEYKNLQKKILSSLNSNTIFVVYHSRRIDGDLQNLYNGLLGSSKKISLIVLAEKDDVFPKLSTKEVQYVDMQINFNDIKELLYKYNLKSNEVLDIINVAGNDLSCIFEIIRIIENSTLSIEKVQSGYKEIVAQVVEEKLKNMTGKEDIIKTLNYAAYFDYKFTQEELEFIFDSILNDQHILNEFTAIIQTSKRENLIEEISIQSNQTKEYRMLNLIRNIFLERTSFRKTHNYKIICKVIQHFFPFDFRLRAGYYFKSGETNKENEMYLLEGVYKLKSGKDIEQDCIINQENFPFNLQKFEKSLKEIFGWFHQNNFEKAIPLLDKYQSIEDFPLVRNELLLLLGYSFWKSNRSNPISALKYLSLVEDLKEFPATFQAAQMIKISILMNSATQSSEQDIKSHFIQVREIYRDLEKKFKQGKDFYNLNILRRKSSAVYSANSALASLKESYEYFQEVVEEYGSIENESIFSNQFLMSLCNYVGALLATGKFENAKEIAQEIVNINKRTQFWIYNYNNYLIALYHLDSFNSATLFKEFQAAIDNLAPDDKIIFSVTKSCLQYLNDKNKEKFYSNMLPESCIDDEYYDYLIYTNLTVMYLIDSCKKTEVEEIFKKSNFIPGLVQDIEKKNYGTRNKILKSLIEKNKVFTYDEIADELKNGFYSADTPLSEYIFYAKPFFLSDVHFWSEN